MEGGDCDPGDEGPGYSELALVASNAIIGEGVSIGPFSVVGRSYAEPVTIGKDTIVKDHVLIEPGAFIGIGCVIEDHCRIGRGSVIAEGSKISSGISYSMGTGQRGAPAIPQGPSAPDSAISPFALVATNVVLGEGVEIGPYAVVGWDGEQEVRIGAGTKILPFALIEPGAVVGDRCLVDAYCRICSGARICDEAQILYGAAVFEQATIGKACIIGGNVADRTVIEDFVTHFGEIAHIYRDPGDIKSWDEDKTPSPIIRARSVVAQNALIIGGREIGPSSYIAAGEVVSVNVPPDMLFQRGKLIELSKTRGLVRTRQDGLDK